MPKVCDPAVVERARVLVEGSARTLGDTAREPRSVRKGINQRAGIPPHAAATAGFLAVPESTEPPRRAKRGASAALRHPCKTYSDRSASTGSRRAALRAG